ncbi:hypothetical protein, partial [Klebsiella pneumoniae]
ACEAGYPPRSFLLAPRWIDGLRDLFDGLDVEVFVVSETLAEHHDIEAPLVMLEALERLHTELGFPTVTMHVNNRKLSEGFYR